MHLQFADEKYIEEAAPGKRAYKRPGWITWGRVAACIALIVVIGIGAWQGGWFQGSEIATLSNGETIHFVRSDSVNHALDLANGVTGRELTEEEIRTLFGDLPVTAKAMYTDADDPLAGIAANQLVGFEGKIGDIKIVITTSDLPLLDTVIVGTEKTSEVAGVTVTAGYFITAPNSRGEQTAIYYATFQLGDSSVYVENAGAKPTHETVKNHLAAVIEQLIVHGELDITLFPK